MVPTLNMKSQPSLKEAANTENNPLQKLGVFTGVPSPPSEALQLYPNRYQNKDTGNHTEADRIRYIATEKLGGDGALIFQLFHLKESQIFGALFWIFPVLTQMLQTMIIFIVPLRLGERHKLFDGSTRRAHKNENVKRCVASPRHSRETQAGSWQLLLLECSQGTGVTQHPLQAAPWDPLRPPRRQNYIRCTLNEAFHPKPLALPAPSQMSARNLHAETVGQCRFGLPAEHTPSLQLSPDKPVMHPSPAGAQLHLVLRGRCNHSTR